MDIMTQYETTSPYPAECYLQELARAGKTAPGYGAKTAVLAAVCAACLLPALGIGIANGGLDEPVAYAQKAVMAVPEAPVAPDLWEVDRVVVTAKAPRKAVRSPRRAVRSCSDVVTEIHGTNVRICDVPRTANAKPGLWEPVAKPTRLVRRDLPSPSGLLR